MPMGLNARNRLIARLNPRPAVRLVKDKEATKRCLEQADIATTPTVARFTDRNTTPEHLVNLPDRWVLKPARGSQGRGIVVATGRTTTGWHAAGPGVLSTDAIVDHITEIVEGRFSGWVSDVAVIEPQLRPTAALAALAPGGLPDVRLVCLHDRLLLAMARLPTLASRGRSNLHQGGIGVSLDLVTGRMVRAVHGGRTITTHPDTDAPLVGPQMSSWTEIVDLARRCSAATGLGYLGVDIVVDATLGPVVLEVNSHPGLEIQNVCGQDLAHLAAVRSGRGAARAA
jgi:alpha-L-glutamate ligase-like protein